MLAALTVATLTNCLFSTVQHLFRHFPGEFHEHGLTLSDYFSDVLFFEESIHQGVLGARRIKYTRDEEDLK